MVDSRNGLFGDRFEELFSEALELPPEERQTFLDQRCSDDSDLLQELSELLSAHAESGRFFEDLASDIAASAEMELDDAAQPNVEIGAYRTLQVIGQGGMGAVYRAERADGAFDQQVALKLLHLDMQTPQLRSRFLAERQLLAQLSHPNIARLVDGGVTEEGRPFFAMEFVDGEPLTDYCRRCRLSVDETLQLFLEVVGAVSYLHRNLIVHRDLKPSNIFVDTEGRVKLLDFGVAKLLADGGAGALTVTGERLLTPQYAAPEQILNGTITTATDVYALGVVLYELLTGTRPHERTLANATSSIEDRATPPSQTVKARGGDRSAWRRLAGDLDTICLKALRVEPERRYASADQMGLDIERYLEGLPVRARRSTIGYRLTKFAGRNRTAVTAGLLLLLALGLGLARERGLRSEAEEARRAAIQETARAEAVSGLLGRLIASVDPAQAQGREITVAEVLERSEAVLAEDRTLRSRPDVEADIRQVLGRTYQGLGRVAEAERQLRMALELLGGLDSEDLTAMAAAEALGSNRTSNYEERERLLRRVLEVRRSRLGVDHQETLSAEIHLIRLLRDDSRLSEAESRAREIFERQLQVSGPRHPETLRMMNALASVLYDQGRYGEAAGIYADALTVSEEVLGSSHPDTLRLVSNLGASYSAAGRLDEAEPLLRRVTEDRLEVLGDRHHQTGMSMHNLGLLLSKMARFEEAEHWFRRATFARQDLHGAGYLFSMNHLADAVRDLGRLDEAESLYLETLFEQRRLLAPGHPDTFRSIASLAELRLLQGRWGEADTLAQEALAGQLRIEGEKRLEAATTLQTLSRLRSLEGAHDEAVGLAERALKISRELLDDGHPDVLKARVEKARALLGAGDAQEARKTVRGVAESVAALLGAEHPLAASARDIELASAKSESGR